MKKLLYLFILFSTFLFQQLYGQIQPAQIPHNQDFNTLASSGSGSAIPQSWAMSESGTNANSTYSASDGSANAGDTYSYGSSGNTERAFGTLFSSSLTPLIGASFINSSGATVTEITITYTGEQWRLGTAGRAPDTLNFQFSLDAKSLITGTWTNYDSLDFSSVITSGTVGALNGNLSQNQKVRTYTIRGLSILPDSVFWIRWTDANASGADDGLAIDDFSLTASTGTTPTLDNPSNFHIGLRNNSMMQLQWSGPTAAYDKVLVFAREGVAVEYAPSGNGSLYNNSDSNYTAAGLYGSSKLVYAGTGASIIVTGINNQSIYFFKAYAYSGSIYSAGTPSISDTAQLQGITSFTSSSGNQQGSISWVNDQGQQGVWWDEVIVVGKSGTAVNGTPSGDASSYTANAQFGGGTEISTVNFIVYKGLGTGTTVTGLTNGTQYFFRAFVRKGGVWTSASRSPMTSMTPSGGGGGSYQVPQVILYPGETEQTLLTDIVNGYKPASVLSYDVARDTMFGKNYNIAGTVTCVYTGDKITLSGSGAPRTDAYNKGFNTEHTYPQSLGATGSAQGDMHHLYPTRIDVNGDRGNLPYGNIPDNEVSYWYRLDVKTATKPSQNIDEYSKLKSGIVFEPRKDHKGNVARSIFYFYTMYKSQADANFFNQQKNTLLQWHYLDPVDSLEYVRTLNIARNQSGKANPFILDTTLIRRAYFGGGTVIQPPGTPVLLSPANQTINISLNPTLTWNGVGDAQSYRLILYPSINQDSIIIDSSGITGTSVTINGLTYNSAYQWKIGASNAGGTTYSAPWSFTTIAAPTVPAIPTLSFPGNGAIGMYVPVNVSWNQPLGATKYRVQVSSNEVFTEIFKDTSDITIQSYTLYDIKDLTKYYWRVSACNTVGWSDYSPVFNFTTALSRPVLAFPENQAQNIPGGVVLRWRKPPYIAVYRIRISLLPHFPDVVFDTSAVADTSITAKGLQAVTTYFWYVEATTPANDKQSSLIWQFTTVAAPSAPVLVYPTVNMWYLPINTELRWKSLSPAVLYRVQVATATDFASPVFDTTGITDTVTTSKNLELNREYFWRVRGYAGGFEGSWSASRNFTTFVKPSTPVPVSPHDSTVNLGNVVTVVWRKANLSPWYRIQLAHQREFSTLLHDTSLVVDTSFTFTNLNPLSKYYWRVQGLNAVGVSDWSQPFLFMTREWLGVHRNGDALPNIFSLEQNYPNPFNPSTTILFNVPVRSRVQITIYDMLGRTVETAVNGMFDAGCYSVLFRADELPSGVYIYRMNVLGAESGNEVLFNKTRRLLFLK